MRRTDSAGSLVWTSFTVSGSQQWELSTSGTTTCRNSWLLRAVGHIWWDQLCTSENGPELLAEHWRSCLTLPTRLRPCVLQIPSHEDWFYGCWIYDSQSALSSCAEYPSNCPTVATRELPAPSHLFAFQSLPGLFFHHNISASPSPILF